ncbi:hypothetical protein [Paraglaciecola arctica]|uniref:Uncharacterized protein n=1 Tax=Paraglaciecola arctica BSs20135 TaxID=493475 RepID=K6YTZ5_9ALTE|nr:hypothetical protein [Paraglaciecola arctica]GAC21642.1 hypothetical protein GARC_4701 [Paraglaciecola arctica BSs20135]
MTNVDGSGTDCLTSATPFLSRLKSGCPVETALYPLEILTLSKLLLGEGLMPMVP